MAIETQFADGKRKLVRTPAPAEKEAPAAENPPCVDVAELPAELRQRVERRLVEGARFEEVVESVNERGGPRVTLAAVRDFFRGSVTLQMQRVRFQVRASQALKAALGNPLSAESDLAEAAFFTGYMCLGRDGSEPTLKDAERARMERENLRLRQRILRLKEQRELQERDFLRARTSLERAKRRKLNSDIRELHRSVTKPGAKREIGPETIQKIREIYGLVRPQPPAPASEPEGGNSDLNG